MGITLWQSLIFFVMVSFFGVYLFPGPRDLGLYYTKANAFHQASFYLQKQFHQDPGDIKNSLRYLFALSYDGRDALFERQVQGVLSLYPRETVLQQVAAEHYENTAQFEKAVQHWTAIARLEPTNFEVREKLVNYWIRAKKQEDLIHFYEEELVRDPKQTDLSYELARLYLLARKPEPAKAVLDKVLEQDPRQEYALILLAEVLEFLGRKDEAVALLRRLWLTNVRDESKALIYSDTLIRFKKFTEVLEVLEPMVQAFPASAGWVERLADVYSELGDRVNALRLYQSLIEQGKAPARFYLAAAEIYYEAGSYRDAAKWIGDYHEKTGGTYHSYHMLGDVLAELRDPVGSKRAYREALRLIRQKARA